MNALLKAARAALEEAGLWRDGATLLCAVSGGCDSVALVHALSRLREHKALRVCAVHVQHGLRGEASQMDERFVRELCRTLDVPLAVENAGLTGDMHTPGMETLARDSRRRIFASQLEALHADALLTAHHQDDQAETVLMHLLRGSGMKGLCGMQSVSPFGGALIVRPFLSLPKERLRDALEAEGLTFREDESNREAITPRNSLRLSVLPQLDALFPGTCEHLSQTAEALAQDEQYLTAQADALYASAAYDAAPLFMLDAAAIQSAHESIRRRVLRRWVGEGLQAAGIKSQQRALSHADTLALSALALQPPDSRVNLPCGLMAAREGNAIHLAHQSGQPLRAMPAYCEPLAPERTQYALPHITLQLGPAQSVPRDALRVVLTPEWLERRPVLRTPQPEDIIRPFGAPGHKPLRRYLTDRHTDPFLRPVWPVLCVQNEVLWCPGLCAAEALRLGSVPVDAVQLTITGETPFIPTSPKE